MTETLPFTASVAAEWIPFAKAAGFFLATFVLEDVACVGAGLMLATGGISWPAALSACFLGIWTGDAGLYALARFAGRGWFERSPLKKFSAKVSASERWFAEHGTPILIFSRLVPGARLPTYLAAGFLRVPLRQFLLVTGIASFIWSFVILLLVQSVGVKLLAWLGAYQQTGLRVLGVGLAFLVGVQILRRLFANFDVRRFNARLGRWRRWEFWPPWMFYPPVAFYYLWLALKYRGCLLPTAANPGIFSGGLIGESKIITLDELLATSPEFTAEAVLIAGATMEERMLSLKKFAGKFCANDGPENFTPFILKPDIGQRGVGVKLIRSRAQMENYLRQTSAPLVAQRYAPGPHEAGIFYYRFPQESRGHLFAITEKIFPVLVGDGTSTVTELVWRDPRARFMAGKYLQRLRPRLDEVLPAGETLQLVRAGNHAQGCIFRDGMHLDTPALRERMDAISQKLPGFFIGRFDLRYASEEDLRAGKNFQIIELNGAASEATSIYDARNSLWSAYRTLFRQWDLVFAIGAANRQRGCRPTRLSPLWKKWREYSRMVATYPAAD